MRVDSILLKLKLHWMFSFEKQIKYLKRQFGDGHWLWCSIFLYEWSLLSPSIVCRERLRLVFVLFIHLQHLFGAHWSCVLFYLIWFNFGSQYIHLIYTHTQYLSFFHTFKNNNRSKVGFLASTFRTWIVRNCIGNIVARNQRLKTCWNSSKISPKTEHSIFFLNSRLNIFQFYASQETHLIES